MQSDTLAIEKPWFRGGRSLVFVSFSPTWAHIHVVHADTYIYINTYIYTYIHTNIHTYIHTQ